jgi:hypothetical protein
MDVCSGFPAVKLSVSGHVEIVDCIVVFVDSLTKFVVIVATSKKGLTGAKIADLYFHHVFKRFGISHRFISDRGSEFVNDFSARLNVCFQIEVSRTTSYHPAGNGQVERYNRLILNKLRCLMHPSDDDNRHARNWADKLTMIEFALNSSVNTGTKHSPFFLNHGRELVFPMEFERQLLLDPHNTDVQTRLQNIQAAQIQAREALDHYQMTKIVSGQRKFQKHNFKPGDRVLLNVKYLHLGSAIKLPKLIPRFIGPFTIQRRLSPNTALIFWTDLCDSGTPKSKLDVELIQTMRRARPVLHVKWFRRYNTDKAPKCFEMQAIVAHRQVKQQDWYTVRLTDGTTMPCTENLILLHAGADFFNEQVQKLFAAKASIDARPKSVLKTGEMNSSDRHKDQDHKGKEVPHKEVVRRKKRSLIRKSNDSHKKSRWEKQNEQHQSRQVVPRDPSKRQATRIPVT